MNLTILIMNIQKLFQIKILTIYQNHTIKTTTIIITTKLPLIIIIIKLISINNLNNN